MNKLYFFLGTLLLFAGCTTSTNQNTNVVVDQSGKYCGGNDALTDVMPIQSHRSHCIKTAEQNLAVNKSTAYTFSIVDDQGNTLKDFAVTHTEQMHVIIVRKDLANFQHLHPDFNSQTGEFTIEDLTFPTAGEYRIFADFMPGSGQAGMMALGVTNFVDVTVGNSKDYVPVELGSTEDAETFGDLSVSLSVDSALEAGNEATVSFNLKEGDAVVTDLEEYLGALGHSVILKEGTLDFIHAHPEQSIADTQTGQVDFMVNFPEAGKYKVFTQFKRNGEVVLTNFVVTVDEGENVTMDDDNMPGMDHSTMGH